MLGTPSLDFYRSRRLDGRNVADVVLQLCQAVLLFIRQLLVHSLEVLDFTELVRVVGTIEHVDPVSLEETFQVCLEKATRPYLHLGRDGALK